MEARGYGVAADDELFKPLYRECVRLGVPVWIHSTTNWDPASPMDLSSPRVIDRLAIEFPDLRIMGPLRKQGHGRKHLEPAARGPRGALFGPAIPGQLNYNADAFDPLWARVQEAGVPITFHVSTGKDPRTTRGPGGAVINFVVHSFAPTMEPLVTICASGVAERFPRLRFGSIEAGIGWLPWLLDTMDEAYLKHHMWVRPRLKKMPSEYFRSNGFASFGEDSAGIALLEEFGLVDNAVWANDYPHHEGTWPHSAQAIQRSMGRLSQRPGWSER